jgi:hypothetical protein
MEPEVKAFLKLYKKFLTEYYGRRCPDFEPGCACCQAWVRYDAEKRACS